MLILKSRLTRRFISVLSQKKPTSRHHKFISCRIPLNLIQCFVFTLIIFLTHVHWSVENERKMKSNICSQCYAVTQRFSWSDKSRSYKPNVHIMVMLITATASKQSGGGGVSKISVWPAVSFRWMISRKTLGKKFRIYICISIPLPCRQKKKKKWRNWYN